MDVGTNAVRGNRLRQPSGMYAYALLVTGITFGIGRRKDSGGESTGREPSIYQPFHGYYSADFWSETTELSTGDKIGFRLVNALLQSIPLYQYSEIVLDAQPFCEVHFYLALYPQMYLKNGNMQFADNEGRAHSAK